MENIKNSLQALAKVASHRAVINEFARSKYNERFGSIEKPLGTYHSYSGYDIISETKLRVEYTYGGGEMDYNGSFLVEIE